ncbi:MAG: hypothetical protein LUG18_01460 [Candidatus Azobacteroides sp.]|nr:hypothetical protein [Candidatus Azobacteroides sp.]
MRLFLAFFILLFFFSSCGDLSKGKKETYENIFAPALKKELLKMMNSKDSIDFSGDKIYCVIIVENPEKKDSCLLFIQPEFSINPDKITGYTFLENKLIACYIFSDRCQNYINKEKLLKVKDSISGYPEILNINYDMIHDSPSRKYEIINEDSLLFVSCFNCY